MQVISFNFIKVQAERKPTVDNSLNINTNIEFLNVEKEKVEILKDSEPIKISFKFTIIYSKKEDKKENEQAKLSFEGFMVILANNEEIKEILKEWKKKQIPQNIRIPLFNIILKKCSLRALQLEEEINIPTHMPFPQISQANSQQQTN
ncbi:MAG: hypothetical protein AABX66_01350 [Nanoarchaeota archaeon]